MGQIGIEVAQCRHIGRALIDNFTLPGNGIETLGVPLGFKQRRKPAAEGECHASGIVILRGEYRQYWQLALKVPPPLICHITKRCIACSLESRVNQDNKIREADCIAHHRVRAMSLYKSVF